MFGSFLVVLIFHFVPEIEGAYAKVKQFIQLSARYFADYFKSTYLLVFSPKLCSLGSFEKFTCCGKLSTDEKMNVHSDPYVSYPVTKTCPCKILLKPIEISKN